MFGDSFVVQNGFMSHLQEPTPLRLRDMSIWIRSLQTKRIKCMIRPTFSTTLRVVNGLTWIACLNICGFKIHILVLRGFFCIAKRLQIWKKNVRKNWMKPKPLWDFGDWISTKKDSGKSNRNVGICCFYFKRRFARGLYIIM